MGCKWSPRLIVLLASRKPASPAARSSLSQSSHQSHPAHAQDSPLFTHNKLSQLPIEKWGKATRLRIALFFSKLAENYSCNLSWNRRQL